MGMSKRKTDKNKKRWFSRKKIFPALIVFMVIFLIVSVTESIIYYRDSKVNAGEPVVTKDGKFDIPKCNSDSEKGSKDNPFVVLEIVPGASSAQFGYLVGGQEPIDIEKALAEDPAAKDVLSKYVEIGEDGVSYTNTDLFKKFGIGLAYKDNDIANGEEISKFEFGGWYLEKECVNPVDADMRLTKDTTVYAKWTAVYPTDEVNRVAGKDETYKPQYTVKFDANCDDAQDSVVGMPEDIKHIEEDSTIVEPNAVPRRKGKLFAGWFTDKECTKSYLFKDRLSGKDRVITLYAKWVDMPDVKFTLEFDANAAGVSDMPGTIENYAKNGMSADFADVTPQNEPKLAGYLFTGWYYDSACTGKFEFNSTIPDDVENNIAEAEGKKVISLYAGWAKDGGDTYTLHFDINEPFGADKDEVEKCEDSLEDLESDVSGRVDGLGDRLKKTLVIDGNVAKKVRNYHVKVITTTPEDFAEYGYKYYTGSGTVIYGENKNGEHNQKLIDRADMIFISEALYDTPQDPNGKFSKSNNDPDTLLMRLFVKYRKTELWYDRGYFNDPLNGYRVVEGSINTYKPEPLYFGMWDGAFSIDFDWKTIMRLLRKNTVGSNGDGTDAVPIIYDLKSIGTVLPHGDTTLQGTVPEHKEEFTTSDGKNVSLDSLQGEYLGKCSDKNTHKLYLMLMQMDPMTVYNAYIEGESRYGRICVDGEHAGCFEYYDAENDRHVYTDKWTFNTLMPVETMSEEAWKEYTADNNCWQWRRNQKESPYDTTGITDSVGYNDYPKLQESAVYYNALATDTTLSKKNDNKGSTLVLELLKRSNSPVIPDEGMKDFIPEEVVDTEGYNTTNALYYLLNGNKAPKKYEDTVRVLDIEPTDGENAHKDKSYWFWYISKYTRNFTGDVKVTETTTWEFAGNIDDLNSEYDLVYIGDSMINPEEQTGSNIKDKVKYDNLKDFIRNFVPSHEVKVNDWTTKKQYYLYSHNGKVIDHKQLAIRAGSIGDTTADSAITKFVASGNDITKIKYNDLLKYAEAGYPIVFGRNLFNSSYINGKLSAKDLNTDTVDKASYIYKLMDTLVTGNKYRSSVFSENENYELRKTDFVNALTENKFALKISSLPAEYIDRSLSKYKDYPDRDVYINGDDIDNKVLEYKIRIDSDDSKKYTLNVYIDTNADGRFNDNERLDALEIRDVTDGRTVRYNNLTGSHTFTIKRDIDSYAGAIPWKLEVIDNSNSLVRKNITGQCAVKVAEKTRLNVLQIVSEGDTTFLKNNVYLPTDDEISKASEEKGRGAVTEANMMDYFDDCIDSINVLRDEVPTIPDAYWRGEAKKEMENVLANSGMFHYYLSKLEEFDVHFDRFTVGEFEQKVREENEANKENEDKDDFLQTRFMDKYDMVIIGYADCYKDVNSEACKVIDTFIEEGKTTLFTHDTTSFVNLDQAEYEKAKQATGEGTYFWGYNINRYFRKIVGMDRYNATDNQGDKKLIDVNDDSYDKPYKTDTDQDKNEFEVDDSSGRALNQGMSNPILYIKNDGTVVDTGSYISDSVTKTNDGQIVSYPYYIPDKLDVATTHAQYYQLNLEEDDIVVWYCIGQPKDGSRWCYSQNNDVRNNYYIYNKGNITYSGAGHSSGMTDQEVKLFINTMIAAYNASVQAPMPTITNPDKSTDNNDTDFVYVDYDATVSPEESKPLGSGVFDNTIKALDGNNKDVKTKRVFFKVANNSIAMNKELTVHYFPAVRDASSGNIRLLSAFPLPLKTYRVDDKDKKNNKNHEGASQVSEVSINVPEKVVAGNKNSKRNLTGGVVESYEEYYADVPITDNYYEGITDGYGNKFTALDNKNQFAIQIQVIMRYGKDRDAKLPLRGYRNLFIMRRGMFALD